MLAVTVDCQLQEKVLTPGAMSAEESLLIPPVRLVCQLVTTRPAPYKVHFGASLSQVLRDFQKSLDVNTTRNRTSSSSKSKGKAKGKSSGSKSSKGPGWLRLEDVPQGVQKGGAKGSPVQALLAMQFNSQEKFIIWVDPNIRRVSGSCSTI